MKTISIIAAAVVVTFFAGAAEAASSASIKKYCWKKANSNLGCNQYDDITTEGVNCQNLVRRKYRNCLFTYSIQRINRPVTTTPYQIQKRSLN